MSTLNTYKTHVPNRSKPKNLFIGKQQLLVFTTSNSRVQQTTLLSHELNVVLN